MKKSAKVHECSYFYGVKLICRDASDEIAEMQNEVIEYAYENSIKPMLEWLFSILFKHNGEFMYAFIIDKEKGPQSVCEPNYLLEDFCNQIRDSLGDDSVVCGEVKSLFAKNGYHHFFG
jgi:hypothetical protein